MLLLTERSPLPPFICLTGDSMDFIFLFFTPLNGVCVLSSRSSLTPCTYLTTLWLSQKYLSIYSGIMTRTPTSAPCSITLTAGITIHYVSAGKGCKGPGRSSRHISPSGPVSEIINCSDKLPGSYFLLFFFYIVLSYIKGADVWKPLILVAGRSCCSSSLT